MRCAVITPYHTEPLWMLQRAHDSVRRQRGTPVHVLVADGHPRSEVDGWSAVHLTLPNSHGDNGNTPRSLGARWAQEQGFDQITFLDADNWYLDGHLGGLQALATQTQADLVVSGRMVVAPDGRRLPSARHTSVRSGGHADTSTVLLQGDGLALADFWDQMPRKLSPMCDQVFCHAARARGLTIAQTPSETLAFTSRYAPHFLSAGVPPPPDCTAMRSLTRATQVWRRLDPAVRSAILLGKSLPPAPPPQGVLVLLAVPDSLPSPQVAVLQAIAAAAGPRLSLQRARPPAGVPSEHFASQLLAQHGPAWRSRVLVVAGGTSPRERAMQQAALASLPVAQDWQRPRLLVLQPGVVTQPPLERGLLQQDAWRVVTLTSAHKARFHTHCPVGDGHVVNASNPSEVAQLVDDVVNAPGDVLATGPVAD